MWLIGNQNNIVNLDHVVDLFVTNKYVTAQLANCASREWISVAEYQSTTHAYIALEMIGKDIMSKNPNLDFTVKAPKPESVDAILKVHGVPKWHHATGKKTKGHGGS